MTCSVHRPVSALLLSKERFEMKRLTGMPTLRNMEVPLRTSMRATSCGVETMTAPIDPISTSLSTAKRARFTVGLYELANAKLNIACTTAHNFRLSLRSIWRTYGGISITRTSRSGSIVSNPEEAFQSTSNSNCWTAVATSQCCSYTHARKADPS